MLHFWEAALLTFLLSGLCMFLELHIWDVSARKSKNVTEENVNYLGHKSEPPAGGRGEWPLHARLKSQSFTEKVIDFYTEILRYKIRWESAQR